MDIFEIKGNVKRFTDVPDLMLIGQANHMHSRKS